MASHALVEPRAFQTDSVLNMSLVEYCCPDCGINFAIPQAVDEMWQRTNKTFFCPNGHSVSHVENSAETKERNKLRKEVEELRVKYKLAVEEAAKLSKQVEDLKLELEIYKPATIEAQT